MQSDASHRPVDADPKSLERYRSYLVMLARWHGNPRLQGKLDPSDIAQQTLVQAWQALDDFRGRTDGEMRAWLRRILTRYLAELARDFGREMRNVAREQPLELVITDSSQRLEAWLDDQQSSPEERAERNEHLRQLAEAIAGLPESQQEAISLHYLHGMTAMEIAAVMGRSRTAVAGLLKRALHTLRRQFELGE